VNRIAVLTSGVDAPGMNAAIRAVVGVGRDKGWDVSVRHFWFGFFYLACGIARDTGKQAA
jgi:6-phosphofructokinase